VEWCARLVFVLFDNVVCCFAGCRAWEAALFERCLVNIVYICSICSCTIVRDTLEISSQCCVHMEYLFMCNSETHTLDVAHCEVHLDAALVAVYCSVLQCIAVH